MNYSKYFSDELTSLKSQGLYRKFRQINRNKKNFPKATERFEGKERAVEVWCSNDYLNLSQHPLVIMESTKVIKELGTGSGGTRNISGTSTYHADLEESLAELHYKESSLLFPSAYTANQSTLWTLCKKLEGCEVYSDELNHASMIQGIKNANVPTHVFRHNDTDHLEELLKTSNANTPKIIVFESLYSMEGLRSPIRKIVSLAKKYNALTYLDEVHSVGLYGPEGRGIAAELNISKDIDIINGTLSKACLLYTSPSPRD